MELILLFDHRFYRDHDGTVFSVQNYNYDLFKERYLQVYDNVHVVARVSDSLSRPRKESEFACGPGVNVLSLGDWQGPVGFIPSYRNVQAVLKSVLVKDAAIIMIAPGTIGGLALAHLSKLHRPYGVEVVGDPYDIFAPGAIKNALRPVFRWWFARQLKRQCAGAAAAAYVTSQALQQRYPPAVSAFTTHYSSIELRDEAFVSISRQYVADRRATTLIMVGTMAQTYKAQDVLIDAVAICVKQGLDLYLILVGDGRYRSELEAHAMVQGVGNRVEFRGQLPAGEAVRAELDRADLFILPSRTEGLPRAMIEAMARGLLCIGSSIGGIPELLPSEDMVPPGDAIALARKIKEVLADPERMTRMSARNLEKAREYEATTLRQRRFTMYRYLAERTQLWSLKKSP